MNTTLLNDNIPATGRPRADAVLTVENLTVVYEADTPVTAVRDVEPRPCTAARSSAWPASPAAARPPWRTRSTACTGRPAGSRPAA